MSRLADGLDALLEATVVGSFTRVGPALRRRLDHWTPVERARIEGRVVVVTGATSGLGLEATRELLRLGAVVEIVARNAAKAEATCAALRAGQPGARVGFVAADVGLLADVRKAAAELRARHEAIHVLIHNAGALDDTRTLTSEGLEQTIATHVVGPFLLTELLRPALRAGAPSRVIWVSSGGMYADPLDVHHLEMPAGSYDGTRAYARAKRAQVTLAAEWAARLAPEGIAVHAMHPGWADTPGVERSLPVFRRVVGPLLRTPAEGVDTILWLATAPATECESGQFWLDRRPRPLHRLASTKRSDTPAERAKLWAWAEQRSGCVVGAGNGPT